MKYKISKKHLFNIIKNTLLVVLGTFVVALGTELFILPAQLDTGGLPGIAICFKYAGFSVDSELIITILTVILFIIGLIFLGWRFMAHTLCSTIVYPLSLYLIKFIVSKFEFLLIANSSTLLDQPALTILLSSLFGGVLVGAGCAITFLGGGSTGGVDIITFVICKYVKKIKSSHMIFAVDAVIVVAGFLTNKEHDIALALMGVFSAFTAAIVIDKIFIGSSKMFVANIITDNPDAITDSIIRNIDRTTTIIDIIGGYTKEGKKMLMVSFSMNEYNEIKRIVYKYDKKAFMTISRAHEIKGEGFEPLEDDIKTN